ncbi:hypothetical protein Hs30E_04700 [Lactococcus hodotermopsidis]|uniref:SseB protein N-terminal domain-containing protein n=1 Tax=Pseudolactococcus hodotermopsidis TaxID=2709157 RepID=A0A6A0B924_9LACT|nr:hypothetical protein [Lactococcus hodotermopsidis]GFH41919.1 hypothetical protein Hs30E_04700 [Lactococcus hodotermopsidis]
MAFWHKKKKEEPIRIGEIDPIIEEFLNNSNVKWFDEQRLAIALSNWEFYSQADTITTFTPDEDDTMLAMQVFTTEKGLTDFLAWQGKKSNGNVALDLEKCFNIATHHHLSPLIIATEKGAQLDIDEEKYHDFILSRVDYRKIDLYNVNLLEKIDLTEILPTNLLKKLSYFIPVVKINEEKSFFKNAGLTPLFTSLENLEKWSQTAEASVWCDNIDLVYALPTNNLSEINETFGADKTEHFIIDPLTRKQELPDKFIKK